MWIVSPHTCTTPSALPLCSYRVLNTGLPGSLRRAHEGSPIMGAVVAEICDGLLGASVYSFVHFDAAVTRNPMEENTLVLSHYSPHGEETEVEGIETCACTSAAMSTEQCLLDVHGV